MHDQEFPTKQQVVNFIRYNAQRSPESIAKNKEIIQALEEALETDIGDKKEAIHHGKYLWKNTIIFIFLIWKFV